MADHPPAPPHSISPEMLLRRLQAFEQSRSFFVQMWLQNPALARQVGERLQAFLRPLPGAAASIPAPPGTGP